MSEGSRDTEETHIIQLVSFARINSEIVKKGTPWILATVLSSSERGPVSPAGKISISRQRTRSVNGTDKGLARSLRLVE